MHIIMKRFSGYIKIEDFIILKILKVKIRYWLIFMTNTDTDFMLSDNIYAELFFLFQLFDT